MATFSDVYEQADRMVLSARGLDQVMAIINDTGSRDFGDAVKHVRVIAEAAARFIEDVEAVQARLEKHGQA